MRYALLLLLVWLSGTVQVRAQNVAINATGVAPAASAMLDITSTNTGVLIPRLALTAANLAAPVAAPAASLLIYNTATAGAAPNQVTPGYYYWDGVKWVRLAGDDWKTLGNTGTVAATNFLGTTDDVALRLRTTSFERFEVTTGTGTAAGTGGRLWAFMDGTAASPIYSWSTSTGLGLFRQANNVMGVATGGTERFRFPNANQVHANADGTPALPFYSWTSGPAQGMYRGGANILSFATTGTHRMSILANGQTTVNTTATAFVGDMFSTFGSAALNFGVSGYAGAGGAGVYGQGIVGNGDGVYGLASAPNILGFGIWGRNLNAAGGSGIVGAGNNLASSILPTGSGGAFTGFSTASYHYFTSPGVSEGLVIQDAFAAQWNVGYYNGAIYSKIVGPGAVSTIVKDLEDQPVTMYCPEAPEILFQDYGTGQLVNGQATIVLDPILSRNILVDDAHPLKVFIQPEGDCNGTYVTNKSATGFEVHELGGGTSTIPFAWSIVATRGPETMTGPGGTRELDYSVRFGPAPEYRERLEVDGRRPDQLEVTGE